MVLAGFFIGGTSVLNAIEEPKFEVVRELNQVEVRKYAPYIVAETVVYATQKEAGQLITLGPTQDATMVFGIYEAASEAEVKTLVEGDPYWKNGIWTGYEIKEWIQAF